MDLKIATEKYSPEINIHYEKLLPYDLAQEIINFIWFNSESTTNVDFELIQETKAKVYKFNFKNQTYYLKSYSSRKISKVLKNFLRPAEALRFFQTELKLIHANIPVAPPVLAITKKINFFLVDSIFVTREVPGVDLQTFLRNNKDNVDLRTKLIKQMAYIWSNLINHHFLHLDPWLGNFIVSAEKGGIRVKLIDIDSIYAMPLVPKTILIVKNLERLHRKLLGVGSNNERNLFINEFFKQCSVLHTFFWQSLFTHWIRK